MLIKRCTMEKGTRRRIFGSRNLLLSAVAFSILLFNSPNVVARTSFQAFSADVVRIVDMKTSTGRIYAIRSAVRAELEGEKKGEKSITIVLLDRNEIYTLQSARKTNIQVPYVDDSGGGDAEFAGYLEGAEVQRESLGVGQIGQYHCDRYLVKITYKNHAFTLIEWAAKELDGFVVRREGQQGEWSSEYSNVQLGPQDPSLFEIPQGYTMIRYSKDWTAITNQMKAEADPSKAASNAHSAGLTVIGDDPTLFAGSASQNRSDYSFEAVDPVTQAEVLRMHIIVDYFPPNSPVSEPLPRNSITVQQNDSGSQYLFNVSFVIPDDPNSNFDTIKIYGMQVVGAERYTEKSYPSVQGHWRPNDRVEFSVRVPKVYADPSSGWNLTFCVGSATSCYPSPNLLTLISQKGK
jgi:hypothetical protein